MTYNKPLPAIRELLDLASQITFPATRQELIKRAKASGLASEVTSFLALFRTDERFISRVDFLTRAEELELLLSQERIMPPELLRSPEG